MLLFEVMEVILENISWKKDVSYSSNYFMDAHFLSKKLGKQWSSHMAKTGHLDGG